MLHDFQSYIGPDSFIILFIYFNFFLITSLKLDLEIGLMTWTTCMISDFKFSTQLISTVFLVGIVVFEVSTQCIRRCLVYRYGIGVIYSLHFDLSLARRSFITDTSVYINYILSITNFCHKMIPIYSISLWCMKVLVLLLSWFEEIMGAFRSYGWNFPTLRGDV